MRRWMFVALAVFALPSERVTAATRVRTKLYFCRRAETPPTIDGVLDDECWKNAYVMEDFGFLNIGDQVGPAPKTYVRILYDKDNLYFAVDCKEPLMDKLRESLAHSGYLFWKDCLEWYIDTQNDDKGFVCLWANPIGESFSETLTDMGWAVVRDYSTFRLWARWGYAPKMNADGWVVEGWFALKDLKIKPVEGTVVGLNPCRFRFVGPTAQFLCWSTVGSRQKNPAEYGHMVLGDAPAALDGVLKRIYPQYMQMIIEMPKGDSMAVYEKGKVSVVSYSDVVKKRFAATGERLAAAEKDFEPVKGMRELEASVKAMKTCREDYDKAQKEYLESAEIGEGRCLYFLRTLDKIETVLDTQLWNVKIENLLEGFRKQVAAAK